MPAGAGVSNYRATQSIEKCIPPLKHAQRSPQLSIMVP
ncbi:Unknown protein sequence [Pseudomonas syringae pv. cilantro]|uniref:Uncharacterized protein n=1 Tax=Pseudomonas syringae pv. cilantro TaxID=81035 RepID=A0A0N1JPT2_PSESX|nr:Unknown protein sequence [Pseudomonas syringae pv. cilantro]